jgi:hypothetical protein
MIHAVAKSPFFCKKNRAFFHAGDVAVNIAGNSLLFACVRRSLAYLPGMVFAVASK